MKMIDRESVLLCLGMSLLSILATSFLFLISPKKLYALLVTIPRDARLIWLFLRLQISIFVWTKLNVTIPKRFRITARENPNKVAFYFEDQKMSFREVDQFSNKVANYFKDKGYKRGDGVALLMDNKPEYVCIWLGLAKLGIVTALLNTNLMSKEALAHAIKAGAGKGIIFGSKFKKLVEDTAFAIPELELYQYNDQHSEIIPGAIDFISELVDISDEAVDEEIDKGKSDDFLVYIYTSGTTGLPKASIIKNMRYFMTYFFFKYGVDIQKEDNIYVPLPLYHALGGMTAVSQSLLGGTTLVLKNKFSASNYWKDCQKYKCTIGQYIGEMVRYVVSAEHKSKSKIQYKLPKMFGNGMKPTVWKDLIRAFNVGQVYEFYGSTEGNFGLINQDNTLGSCGYTPIVAELFSPATLVKCDSTGEVIRNRNGFCDVCSNNEPGLLICKITKLLSMTKFDGYSDEKSTSKKILTKVFKQGDQYFNTGDILSRDEFGYFYFRDRTGDTFRWKGENVSTVEVEEILSGLTNTTIAVYGVEVAGNEGKAGMAAIADPKRNLDLKQFLQDCKSALPAYSVPVFLRIVDEIPQTGTFKIQKTNLQKDGYNIGEIEDTVYFLHPEKKEYVILDSNLYSNIINNESKV
ncbi:hypothetical protein HHI36_001989 [Cryptolaemus montrouzieri]|uniref:long-chain-fatty-acid--CoA ligase n=1 Tax=Cryptolaemus montrouzieri TaxID=559131 RepID=A0ABD2P9F6_9CUCU